MRHIEFLVEEESCAEALKVLIPRLVGATISFDLHVFQGKADLLNSLEARLKGYAKWLPNDYRIVVLVDCDGDNCRALKKQLEEAALAAGMQTKASAGGEGQYQVLTRIAIEELEAWFFGDVKAMKAAYPRVPATLAEKRGFRDPDAIAGGTWEKLERVLKAAGYYRAGMPKIEVARNVSRHMDPARNQSRSFQVFCRGLKELVA